MIPDDCENPTTINTHCKVCGNFVTLFISKEYAEMKDPHGIVPMATCNSCFDMRQEGVRLYRRMLATFSESNRLQNAKNKADRIRVSDSAKAMLKMADLIANWAQRMRLRVKGGDLSILFPAKNYANPRKWVAILERNYNGIKSFGEQLGLRM